MTTARSHDDLSDEELVAAFQDQIARIREATKDVENGGMPDLQALEGEVETLCTRATSSGPETLKSLRALMAIMIDQLETLARRIKEHHDIDTATS